MDRSNGSSGLHRLLFVVGFGIASAMSMAPLQAQEMCGATTYPFPYTDVASVGAAFCPGIMEAYVTGISKGTSSNTFSPNDDVPRLQMTTFLQRTVDQVLTRGSRRAALNQWWVPQNYNVMLTVSLPGTPQFCAADGENVWVTTSSGTVAEIQPSTGAVLQKLTGASAPQAVLAAFGMVFVTGQTSPGNLYQIFPRIPYLNSATSLPGFPAGIAFDGTNIWTANESGSVSIIDPNTYAVTTVSAGFGIPNGMLYDGANIWVTDFVGTLLKLDSSGNILKTVPVGGLPQYPVFDGINIWVPNELDNSITVVQASTGNVVATIASDASNQLNGPWAASFDGERILVTNRNGGTVTVFKAADLSFIANVSVNVFGSATPLGVCNDGINFWIPLGGTEYLLRF